MTSSKAEELSVIFIVVKFTIRPDKADEWGGVHVNSDHFKNAIAWIPEVIMKKPEIVNVEVPGDGWGQMAELTPATTS